MNLPDPSQTREKRRLAMPLSVVIFWLLVHPTAWRKHVLRIDSSLPPDFCLVALTPQQRKNKRLWMFLAGEWFFVLVEILIISAVYWTLTGLPQTDVVGNILHGLSHGLFGALAFGALVSVGSGLVFGPILGLGVAFLGMNSMTYIFVLAAALSLASSVHLKLTAERTFRSLTRDVTGFVTGIILVSPFILFLRIWFYGNPSINNPQSFVGSAADNYERLVLRTVLLIIFIGLTWVSAKLRSKSQPLQNWLIVAVIAITLTVLVLLAITSPIDSYAVIIGIGGGSTIFQGIVFSLAWSGARRIGGGFTAATVATLLTGIASLLMAPSDLTAPYPTVPMILIAGLISIIGLLINPLRHLFFFPLVAIYNHVLYSLDQEGRGPLRYFHSHAVFWDEYQLFPWPGLSDYLVLLAERQPSDYKKIFLKLAEGRQRKAVLKAQLELNARLLAACQSVDDISKLHKELLIREITGHETAMIYSFLPISRDLESALNQISSYHQRLSLGTIRDSLLSLRRDLLLSKQSEAQQLSIIAGHWDNIISDHIERLTLGMQSRAEIDNPYICGVPLNDQQEVFVGRVEIMARIEHLLLSENCPPLLLYGQRRMGKTSLLLNISHFLPTRIIPCFVDAQSITIHQNPINASMAIIAAVRESAWRTRSLELPHIPSDSISGVDLHQIRIWSDQTHALLIERGMSLLIMMDEFEALSYPYKTHSLITNELMTHMRHLLQHHHWFRLILSGAHSVDEMDIWSHLLISSQIVKIGYLESHEALQLIEQPVKNFGLKHSTQTAWHIIGLTRAHPYLLQALCFELVMLKNEQPESIRYIASIHDIEKAAERVFDSNRFFFTDITQNQISPSARDMLSYLALLGKGKIITAEEWRSRFSNNYQQNLQMLIQRELIAPEGPGYRFQIELIRRWFAKQVV